MEHGHKQTFFERDRYRFCDAETVRAKRHPAMALYADFAFRTEVKAKTSHS